MVREGWARETAVQRPEDTQWGPWLALRMVRGVGNVAYRALLEAVGNPAALLRTAPSRLESYGLRPEVARAVAAFNDWPAVTEQLRRLERVRGRLVTWCDDAYPPHLREIRDPPPFLFVSGDLQPDDALAVAVVGTRAPSAYGRQMTRVLCEALARLGITVVSGLARGIDAEAHAAALRSEGRTLAVLGSGIDVVYPSEHHSLFRAVRERGAVVSEFMMGVTPEAENFPHRNRIISGMAMGTLVIEATERSGSLITAQCAAEQGREVFAVPGRIDSLSSQGCHDLIRDGVALVRGPDDILEALGPLMQPVRTADGEVVHVPRELSLSDQERAVLNLVTLDPQHVDQLLQSAELETSRVLATLTILEMKRLVRRLPGGYFVRAG